MATIKELNRDIKNLNKNFVKCSLTKEEFRQEFFRLYLMDKGAEYINKNNLLIMLKLNRIHRFIKQGEFYISANV